MSKEKTTGSGKQHERAEHLTPLADALTIDVLRKELVEREAACKKELEREEHASMEMLLILVGERNRLAARAEDWMHGRRWIMWRVVTTPKGADECVMYQDFELREAAERSSTIPMHAGDTRKIVKRYMRKRGLPK